MGVKFWGATLQGANLIGANLKDATGLTQAQAEVANSDWEDDFPD